MSCHSKEVLEQMLFDVVDELDLSDKTHGPLGTPPAELVRLVLRQKDKTIQMLKSGMVDAAAQKKVAKPTTLDAINDDAMAETVLENWSLSYSYSGKTLLDNYRAAVLARMENKGEPKP